MNYRYPPVSREDWRAHWRFCAQLTALLAVLFVVSFSMTWAVYHP